jgi:hypothetical protein
MQRSNSTSKSKAPASFLFQFCRLGSSWLFMNSDTLYTLQRFYQSVHALVMHMA